MEQVRRRELMPAFLKGYCVAFVVSAVLLVLTFAFDVSMGIIDGVPYREYSLLIDVSIIALILASMSTTLWFEWKWAVWYNLFLGSAYFLCALLALIIEASPDMLFWGTMLTFPYWMLLLQIRRPWQYVAVRKL